MCDANACIGLSDRGQDVLVDLARPYHFAIQCMTRSGKSNLMYCLLAEAARHPHVVVGGCDPTGILLKPFRTSTHEQFRFLGGPDLEGAATALGALTAEMDRRIGVLLSQESDNLTRFSVETPLILIVMEEYPGLLASAEALDAAEGARGAARLAPAIARDVQRLVQESAKVGMRVLVLAQRAEASVLGSAVRSNLAMRITLRVDNADSVRMLHPHASPSLVKQVGLFEPGQAILDGPSLPLTAFRADVLPYASYLRVVHERLADSARSRDNRQEGCENVGSN